MMANGCERICRFADENERLRDQIEAMLQAMQEKAPALLALRMTPRHRLLAGLLMERDFVSTSLALTIIEAGRSPYLSINSLTVQIHSLRKVFRQYGAAIETVSGLGYRIAPESKRRLLEAAGEMPPADEDRRARPVITENVSSVASE